MDCRTCLHSYGCLVEYVSLEDGTCTNICSPRNDPKYIFNKSAVSESDLLVGADFECACNLENPD